MYPLTGYYLEKMLLVKVKGENAADTKPLRDVFGLSFKNFR